MVLAALSSAFSPSKKDCLDPEDGSNKLFEHNKIMLNPQQGTVFDLPLQIISVQCQFSTSES
jgi:hypothetical protein